MVQRCDKEPPYGPRYFPTKKIVARWCGVSYDTLHRWEQAKGYETDNREISLGRDILFLMSKGYVLPEDVRYGLEHIGWRKYSLDDKERYLMSDNVLDWMISVVTRDMKMILRMNREKGKE